jgi:mono/diheme cytochrome c family protein
MRTLVLSGCIVLAAAWGAWAQGDIQIVADEEPFPLVGWPDGDADAGRKAFVELRCTHCHAVPSIQELAAKDENLPGPDLVGYDASYPRLFILRQIVAPGSDDPAEDSHMGSFADVMTVQQLTDVVAFVESLKKPSAGD